MVEGEEAIFQLAQQVPESIIGSLVNVVRAIAPNPVADSTWKVSRVEQGLAWKRAENPVVATQWKKMAKLRHATRHTSKGSAIRVDLTKRVVEKVLVAN